MLGPLSPRRESGHFVKGNSLEKGAAACFQQPTSIVAVSWVCQAEEGNLDRAAKASTTGSFISVSGPLYMALSQSLPVVTFVYIFHKGKGLSIVAREGHLHLSLYPPNLRQCLSTSRCPINTCWFKLWPVIIKQWSNEWSKNIMHVYSTSSLWDWKTVQCLQNNNSPNKT